MSLIEEGYHDKQHIKQIGIPFVHGREEQYHGPYKPCGNFVEAISIIEPYVSQIRIAPE